MRKVQRSPSGCAFKLARGVARACTLARRFPTLSNAVLLHDGQSNSSKPENEVESVSRNMNSQSMSSDYGSSDVRVEKPPNSEFTPTSRISLELDQVAEETGRLRAGHVGHRRCIRCCRGRLQCIAASANRRRAIAFWRAIRVKRHAGAAIATR